MRGGGMSRAGGPRTGATAGRGSAVGASGGRCVDWRTVSGAGGSAYAEVVLVVDYGAQYAQLIARRVREARVYSEVVPHTMPVAEMLARRPVAIILSGGPASVYAEGAPGVAPALFGAGVPVLGIRYGFRLMARALGGTVAPTGSSESCGAPL